MANFFDHLFQSLIEIFTVIVTTGIERSCVNNLQQIIEPFHKGLHE